MKFRMLVMTLIIALAMSLAACKEEGPMEKAGKSIDKAAHEVEDAAKDAADKVEDEVEKAKDGG